MLYCEHCKVELPGVQSRCPLCKSRPAGDPDTGYRPYPELKASHMTLSRTLVIWAAFAGVCAAAICVGINFAIPDYGWWSFFVIAGIASFWIDFAILLKKRRNLPKNIIWQVVLVSIIALIWDFATGYRGWSLDFVIPILSSVAMFVLIIVSKAQKLGVQDYIVYLVMACVLGLVSFVMLLTGLVNVVVPSVVSFISAVVFLAFLLFFEGKTLWAEFQRRLHM